MKILKWADLRGKHKGQLAFILHRITGPFILLYLLVHLYVLSYLLNPSLYQKFLSTMESPPFIAFDILLFLAIFYHGANGIRLIFSELGIGTKRHKLMFWIMLILGLIGWIALSYIVAMSFLRGA